MHNLYTVTNLNQPGFYEKGVNDAFQGGNTGFNVGFQAWGHIIILIHSQPRMFYD